jgi:hypothetical protein
MSVGSDIAVGGAVAVMVAAGVETSVETGVGTSGGAQNANPSISSGAGKTGVCTMIPVVGSIATMPRLFLCMPA